MKHKITKKDFDLNPFFARHGFKVGDEIEIPAKDSVTSQQSTTDEPDPPGVEVPKKPPPPQP